MERVIAKQLVDHIHRHDLDNSYQSAYKPGHSTETALLSIKIDIHLSLSHGEATALVLLDLLAAFDMIDHSTLLLRVPVVGPLLFSVYTFPLSTLIGKHKGVNSIFILTTHNFMSISHTGMPQLPLIS